VVWGARRALDGAMTPRLFMLILISVSLSAMAQLALKLGAHAAVSSPASTEAGGQLGALLRSPMVFAGFSLYGVGAVLWLLVLSRAPLSVAYPFVGLGFILTLIAGATYLHEDVTWVRVLGTVLIAAGAAMVARSS
jgi:drug/metabolite transporter (DMT)-like permease